MLILIVLAISIVNYFQINNLRNDFNKINKSDTSLTKNEPTIQPKSNNNNKEVLNDLKKTKWEIDSISKAIKYQEKIDADRKNIYFNSYFVRLEFSDKCYIYSNDSDLPQIRTYEIDNDKLILKKSDHVMAFSIIDNITIKGNGVTFKKLY